MIRTVRIAAASVSAVALVALAGCSAGAPEQSEGPTTVTLSTWMYDEPGIGDYWKLVIDGYEESTGNTVEVRNLPINEYSSQLVVEMAAGNPADIVFIPAAGLAEIAAIGDLEDLGPLLEETGIEAALAPAALDYVTIDDSVTAFPVAGRTLDLLWNQELFAAAGITAPPATPDEFLDVARELTIKEGDKVVQYGASMVNAQEDPTYEMLLMWTIAFGGNLAEDGVATVNSPEAVEALEFMKTLYDEELIPRGALEDDQRALFANGTSAMEIDGNWQIPFVETIDPARAAQIAASPLPWEGATATGGPNIAVAISGESSHKAAASEFIEFLASDEIIGQFTDFASNIPLMEGAVSEETLADRPYLQASIDAIGSAVPIAPSGFEDQSSEFQAIVIEAIVSSLQSGVDPQTALDQAQQQIESDLAE